VQGASRDKNAELLESVNRTGRAFLSHTDLGGAYTLRFAVSGAQTQVRAAGLGAGAGEPGVGRLAVWTWYAKLDVAV